MNRIELLGVQIDNVTYDDVLGHIRQMIADRKPQQIVSPAIDQIIQARRDPEFNMVMKEAALVLADGVSVTLAAWLHKTPLKQRVTGADLVPKVCELAAKEGFSIFFLGGEEGVANQVAAIMQERFPGLRIAGTYCPPYRFEDNPAEEAKVIDLIKESGADVLFTALSSPRQEKWIRRRKDDYQVSVSFGVGGAFNFITGREKRAPVWMQTTGIEWVFRMMQRPVTVGKRIFRSVPVYFMLMFDRLFYARQKQAARWFRPAILAFVDTVLSLLVYLLSYWLYFRQLFPAQDPYPEIQSLLNTQAYGYLFYFLPFSCIPAVYLSKLYRRNPYISSYRLMMQCLKAVVLAVFFIIGFQFLFSGLFADISGFSRGVFGLFGFFFGIGLLLWRLLFLQTERLLHQFGFNLDRIVLVGCGDLTRHIIDIVSNHPEWGLYLAGYVTVEQEQFSIQTVPCLGTIHDLERILPARKVDEVLITVNDLPLEQVQRISELCRKYKIQTSFIPSAFSVLTEQTTIKQFGDCRVISLHKTDSIL